MIELGNPVFRIEAVHFNDKGKKDPDNLYFGLRKVIYLCKGAKVFLTSNLNT